MKFEEGGLGMAKGIQTAAIPVELTIDQLIEGFKRLPQAERATVLEALEDYFFGQFIEVTMKDRMYSREEALYIVERAEMVDDVAG